jgi:hypothetical protein
MKPTLLTLPSGAELAPGNFVKVYKFEQTPES